VNYEFGRKTNLRTVNYRYFKAWVPHLIGETDDKTDEISDDIFHYKKMP
jgi:hypothetical protein